MIVRPNRNRNARSNGVHASTAERQEESRRRRQERLSGRAGNNRTWTAGAREGCLRGDGHARARAGRAYERVTSRGGRRTNPGRALHSCQPVSFPAARSGGRHIARSPSGGGGRLCVFISSLYRGFRTFSHPWTVAPRIPVRWRDVTSGARVRRTRRARNGRPYGLIATTNSARGIRRVRGYLERWWYFVDPRAVRRGSDRPRRAVVPRCHPRRSFAAFPTPSPSLSFILSLCVSLSLCLSLSRRSVLDRSGGTPTAPRRKCSRRSSHHPLREPPPGKDASA